MIIFSVAFAFPSPLHTSHFPHTLCRDQNAAITPEIRGVIAETALTGLVRYPWHLLTPILHRLLDAALSSLASDLAPDQEGPPRPMPTGGTFEDACASLHTLLDDFSAPPFTFQRLCELILEPSKQYNRAEKLAMAIERLLLVTSTLRVAKNPPPLPSLASLGPVNENPPSPYDGQPPAGPPPSMDDRIQPSDNGMMDSDEYAIFVSADAAQPTGQLVTGEAAIAVGAPVDRAPPPMEPAEVIQAEAFVQAALATPPEEMDVGEQKEQHQSVQGELGEGTWQPTGAAERENTQRATENDTSAPVAMHTEDAPLNRELGRNAGGGSDGHI